MSPTPEHDKEHEPQPAKLRPLLERYEPAEPFDLWRDMLRPGLMGSALALGLVLLGAFIGWCLALAVSPAPLF